MRLTVKEADVLKACLQFLKLFCGVAFRNNTGALPATYRGKSRLIRFGEPGSSDLLAVLPASRHGDAPGRLLAVECKRPGGKPSPLQAAFLERVRAAGGVGLVADSVASLERQLAELGYSWGGR